MAAKWWIHLTKKLISLCQFSYGSHGKEREQYDKFKCDEKTLSLEEPLEEFSTSPTNGEPQVILSNGQSDHATSTPSPTYVEGNEMVIGNNAFTCGTCTSSSFCGTNILKEE